MSEEPKWPTEDAVRVEAMRREQVALEYGTHASLVGVTIDMCRAAWLAANDDPRVDPIGTIRQRPGSAYVSVRANRPVIEDDDGKVWPWLAIHPTGYVGGDAHDTVKGWPVVGAIPGTPAAEAQR